MNRKIKKILSAALACTIILGSSLTAQISASSDTTAAVVTENTEVKTYKLTKKKLPTYVFNTEKENTFNTPLYFVNGSDVPYLKVEDWITLYKKAAVSGYGKNDFEVTVKKDENDDNVVYLIRENGFYMGIDFANDKFGFWDYNAFVDIADNGLLEMTDSMNGEDGSPRYLRSIWITSHL